MGEFADAASLTRLLGAPPGHVGHDEPGQLTEALRRDPYAVLLFDEVEKAHREVTGALLALLDAGRLTDSHGRSVDATHAVVVLTSNLGAELILAAPGGDVELAREPVLALARVVLRPELVNRVDEVVLFAPLSPAALAAITGMVLGVMLLLARAAPVLVWPLAAVGAIPLTLYTLHVTALALFPVEAAHAAGTSAGELLVTHLLAALVIGVAVRAAGRRGPLEAVVRALSGGARRAVVGGG